MSNDLPIFKNCPECDALIEAKEQECNYCNHVFESPELTKEEKRQTYKEIIKALNGAYFRLENFMYAQATSYQHFDFDRTFTVLLLKTREIENYNIKNFKLIDKYWSLNNQIIYDYDKGNYTNRNVNDNEDFSKDMDAIYHINNGRLHEFLEFTTPEDLAEKRLSILDIQKEHDTDLQSESTPETKNVAKPNLKHSILLSAFLKESSKTYQNLFELRYNTFAETTEATRLEFIELEIQFFENCKYDLENHEASTDGFSKLGIKTFKILDDIVSEIGFDTFNFATKRKLEFLTAQKEKITDEDASNLDFLFGTEPNDIEKPVKKPSSKKKQSLSELSQKSFFKKIRNGKLTQLEIHNKTEQITDSFKLEKLKILKKDFEFFLFVEKDDHESSYSTFDIQTAIEELNKKNKEIPTNPIKDFQKDVEGKIKLLDTERKIINKEKLLYPFEFFFCYQFQAYLENEIKKHNFSSRDYTKYNIKGPQAKYDIDYNQLVKEIARTFDVKVIDNLLNNELYKLKKINREGYEENKGDFYNTYKSRADWVENTILICDNEFIYTKKLAFKNVIKWCKDWRERYLPLFDPYSPEEKEKMHKDLFKPLWQELDEYYPSQNKPVVSNDDSKSIIRNPNSFSEIFTEVGWEIYIDALHQIEYPILDSDYNFIGKPKGDKGVLCAWINELKKRGKIFKRYNRQHFVVVLNNEIKGLDLGIDGKTFNNTPASYTEKYRDILLKHTNLLP